MSNLNVDQKTIRHLLSDKKSDFLIPDYQRPYAWNEDQCGTLWDDIFSFAFPDNKCDQFDDDGEEYFLGSIVTFRNGDGKLEVIDGQQRLTTILLVLRAFYDKFENMLDENSKSIRDSIEQCIWKTNAFGKAEKSILKIDSEVATDGDKEEFLDLLRTGKIKFGSKSQYVKNYQFFQEKINEFISNFAAYLPYFPVRLLNNCILLPIEAESQDTALRIFSTLNDRGRPLSDADIFKAQFYKYYGSNEKKDDFIAEWRSLEVVANSIFQSKSSASMDELFTRYMYFLRAHEGNKSTTTLALRKFYERNKYQYFYKPNTLEDLKRLALFWQAVMTQDKSRFSNEVLKRLYVLNYAPNGMWQNIVSVFFLKNKGENDLLENQTFCNFLKKITAFIFAYAIKFPGVNALRAPIYDEMVNVVNGIPLSFSAHKFSRNQIKNAFENYIFTNQRSMTRSMLTWYAFTFEDQVLPNLNADFDIEHIYAKKRQELESGLSLNETLELLGNKILLEESINIKASDYRFEDKKKIYTGECRRGKNKEPSAIFEIQEIASYPKFEEGEIIKRDQKILNSFLQFLESEDLIEDV